MSDKTKAFLVALGENPETVARFRADPKAVMVAHGVPEAHQLLILKGDKAGLVTAAGLDDFHANFFIV